MEILWKLQDGLDPVAKTPYALRFMKYDSIAEDELLRFRIRPAQEKHSLLAV